MWLGSILKSAYLFIFKINVIFMSKGYFNKDVVKIS